MTPNKIIKLQPVKESTSDFDHLEARLKLFFKRELYYPLLVELGEPQTLLKNSALVGERALIEAISSGRVTFSRGAFYGKFNSEISKSLKKLGAKWDNQTKSFKIRQSELPSNLISAISGSEAKFQQKMAKIDKMLADLSPQVVASKFKSADLFDTALWKTEKALNKTLEKITISPTLTKEDRLKIAEEYQENMRLWIQDFTEKEIKKLRKDMGRRVFEGARYEGAVESIQKSHGVSVNKAKFLARQETALLMTTFKESRYQQADVHEYEWICVKGSPAHPVRPMHKALEGKIFRFDNPPVTSPDGSRNNPGRDYNCRCTARPIVRFKPNK